MYLTGMGTTLSSFFQITTMTVSVPSVILITCLIVTLWGGAIRFTTAMLFALAFLPMFGIGGVTGLPLGLAPTNLVLHDTYYVIGHFHYLVAPGTMFALFAAVYHWFPKMTGRRLHEGLGVVHFIGSFVTMNAVFLPMFFMGLMGVNRRLYDGGLQYELAAPTLAWNATMTWSAVALGLFQLVFVWNLVRSARHGAPAENPWRATTLEWATASPPPAGNFVETPVVTGPPYRYEEGEA
jgi:cytochrome c oxidase subunit 1